MPIPASRNTTGHRMHSSLLGRLSGAVLALGLTLATAQAEIIDWDVESWAPAGRTNLSETYSSGVGTVTVTLSGNTDFLGDPTIALDNSPSINANNTGGLIPVEQSLLIATNYPDSSNNEVVVTLDFSGYPNGVSNVVINIFDIDAAGAFHDDVRVTAVNHTGVINPTSLTSSSQNGVTGPATISGTPGTGAPSNSADGTGLFEFAQFGITQVNIRYRNLIGQPDPGFQSISIHDIQFVDPGEADLSLIKTVDDPTPDPGDSVIFTLTVTNDGPDDATAIEVTDLLPNGFSYTSHNGTGTYNPGTGLWNVGDIPNGESRSLNIQAMVNATGSYNNIAEITRAEQFDPDSTPGNNVPSEDDQDSASAAPASNPVAVDDNTTTDTDTPVAIDSLVNDSDPGSRPLCITSFTDPPNGSVVLVDDPATPGCAGDSFIYTPDPGFEGTDTFDYTMENDIGGSDTATVTVIVGPTAVIIEKNASPTTALPGGLVTYTIAIENIGAIDIPAVDIVDLQPAGFYYLDGSVRLDGIPDVVSVTTGRPLTFSGIPVPRFETVFLSYTLQVGAGVTQGDYINEAEPFFAGTSIGNKDTATVTITADPDFDETTIIGKVFNDLDSDGWQDPGEQGLPGVLIGSTEGLIVETDQHGRYHLAGLDGGLIERGRNFILKVDPVSLPRGTTFTTENPRVRRITRGLVNRFDFGVRLPGDAACCDTVELKLSEIFFDKDADSVDSSYLRVLGQFADRLRIAGGGIITIEGVAAVDESVATETINEPMTELKEYTLTPRFGVLEATLSRSDRADLDRIAKEWESVEDMRVEVIGHTSNVGISSENQDKFRDNYELSRARAQTVADYLRNVLGLSQTQVIAAGRGPDDPVASNDTASGRAANRRVEVRMTGNVDQMSVPGASAVRFSSPVYNRDLAERRAVGVYLALKRLLGEELVRNVDFRVLPESDVAIPSVERACTEEACVGDQGYEFVMATRENTPQISPDSTKYSGQSDRRADIRGEFVLNLADGGQLWTTEDPTRVEPRLAVSGPPVVAVSNGRAAATNFYIYNNYAAFMQSAELEIYAGDGDRVEPVASIPVPLANFTRVTWNGGGNDYRNGDVLSYRLRARDAEGTVDKTQFREMRLREMDPQEIPGTRTLTRSESGIPEGKIPAPKSSPLSGNVLVFLPGSQTERRDSQDYTLSPRFGTRRTNLSARDKAELDSIARQWRGATAIRIEAVGHTDNIPIAAANRAEFANNQVLSEARAESVAEYVAGVLGIARSSIRTSGRADLEPIDTNNTIAGRARNRRVELTISAERVSTLPASNANVRLVNPDTGGDEPVQFSIEEAENFLSMKYEIESTLAAPDSIQRLKQPTASATPSPADFSAQESADALQDIYGRNDLAQQNIPIHGSRVRLHGRDIANNTSLRVNGRSLPMDTRGDFAIEYLLPVGQQAFDVEFFDSEGNQTQKTTIPVNVTGESMYVVAMVDLTLSSNDLKGSVEPLGPDDRYQEDFLAEGRIAFYLKGKIKGKYLVTAQLDTQEEELGDLISNLDEKNPRSVFRRLDPDRYYPVYGDDSTTISDTDSQGRLYVKAQWDRSEARWGNYHTGITGTEFAQYNRSLYGGRLHHRSVATTDNGDAKLEGIVFLSETQTAFGHSEFLGTGGSLYYLKHRDVLPGSEKLTVEIRDRDSNRVLLNKALVRGADYEIDEIQGRVILARPLAQVSDLVSPSLIHDKPLDGDNVFLLADYEYIPDGFSADKITVGGRGKYWINDTVAIGATLIDESRGGDDYQLGGLDLTVQATPNTYLKLEMADTDNTQAERFYSDDGGMDFTALNDPTTAGRSGDAVSVEGRANLADWLDMDNDWVLGAWWRDTDKDFSVARRDTGVDTAEYGIEANGHVGERLKVSTRYSVVERDLVREDRALSAQADFTLTDRSSIAGEVRMVEEELPGGPTDDATLLALRYTHRLNPQVEIWGTGQATADSSTNYDNNDRVSVGTRILLRDHTTLTAEFGDGHRGQGGSMTLDHEISSDHRIYGTYTHSTDRTDPLAGRQFAVGHRSQISNQTTMFNEMQFMEQAGQSGIGHVFGLDFAPGRGWEIGLTAQQGTLEGPQGSTERDAASIAMGYHSDGLRWVSRVEYRDDNGASDRRQWVLTNRADLRLSESSRILGRVNVSDTVDQRDELGNAKFAEGSIGWAYRPVDDDRWNILTKYTYLYDLPGLYQVDTGTDQRSQIISGEGIYRLSRRWEIGGKLAVRESDLRQSRDDGDWFESTATFAALRASYHLLHAWDGLVEYRLLDLKETDNVRRGYLLAVERHFGDHLKLGLGYNFTDFSDDLGDLDYDHKGFFLNAVGKY